MRVGRVATVTVLPNYHTALCMSYDHIMDCTVYTLKNRFSLETISRGTSSLVSEDFLQLFDEAVFELSATIGVQFSRVQIITEKTRSTRFRTIVVASLF